MAKFILRMMCVTLLLLLHRSHFRFYKYYNYCSSLTQALSISLSLRPTQETLYANNILDIST